jgi:hypothetical protein
MRTPSCYQSLTGVGKKGRFQMIIDKDEYKSVLLLLGDQWKKQFNTDS